MSISASTDLGSVIALLQRVELPTEDLTEASVSDFRVVERDGAVVGCVAVEAYGDAGLLRSLAVAPEAQGDGLERRLVGAAEALARERGVSALYLLTTTAASFFERVGYRLVDRADVPEPVRQSPQFASCCPASAACLGKTLSL